MVVHDDKKQMISEVRRWENKYQEAMTEINQFENEQELVRNRVSSFVGIIVNFIETYTSIQ